MADKKPEKTEDNPEASRRDFLVLASGATAAVGIAAFAWPLIQQMNPASDVLALSSIEIDLSKIAVGQSITVKWRGKPVFIRHRTAEEINAAANVNLAELPDPQNDKERAKKPEWLVVVGICTHLGCVPSGQKVGENRGEHGGWYCPCHGSQYDTSGRIRKGPAPTNLPVPSYEFIKDNIIRIG
ncbi:MAG TPA: ubiquinol-cytochrome c reductase iron-sulfur subunit [Alphaproteobacteria bacterium]|jgi:ubiquinol-cytochrome c reductase iron-sulfur subunit|nr:ubiquinol-cytochrome c reductase iron-sulfur subunit [Alphaproteobacteria bacterium]